MDRRFNSPKPSPGFVYFKTAATHPADKPDFLSFSDNGQTSQQATFKSPRFASPQQNKFSPGFSSSPVDFRNSPRGNWNPNRSGSQQYDTSRRSNSFNHYNSNQSFQSSWNSSGNASNNFNCSDSSRSYQNASRNSNRYSARGFGSRGKKRGSDGEKKYSIEDYIHPSFFEDPWAILEKNLEKSRAMDETKIDSNKSTDSSNSSSSSSSSSENET